MSSGFPAQSLLNCNFNQRYIARLDEALKLFRLAAVIRMVYPRQIAITPALSSRCAASISGLLDFDGVLAKLSDADEFVLGDICRPVLVNRVFNFCESK
jgi:hypothetical protein